MIFQVRLEMSPLCSSLNLLQLSNILSWLPRIFSAKKKCSRWRLVKQKSVDKSDGQLAEVLSRLNAGVAHVALQCTVHLSPAHGNHILVWYTSTTYTTYDQDRFLHRSVLSLFDSTSFNRFLHPKVKVLVQSWRSFNRNGRGSLFLWAGQEQRFVGRAPFFNIAI